MSRQFIYFLSLLFVLSLQNEHRASAASKNIWSPAKSAKHLFEQDLNARSDQFGYTVCNAFAPDSVLTTHTRKHARFRVPSTTFRMQERFPDLQKHLHFTTIVAVNSHYYSANFSSQQYSFLFRLTPF